MEARYYEELACAFIRGRMGIPDATIADGLRAGLRLHKFKAHTTLARVQKVIGTLRGIAPVNLLDIGSGRGTFLWPLLAAFPALRVTAIDSNERRAADLAAVRAGGIERLSVARMDVQALAFAPRSFDVVTMLEVLEHLPRPLEAMKCAAAVARRFVVLSVPATPDENPEHLRLFTIGDLDAMAGEAGAARVTFDHVLNHRIAVLRVAS